MFPTRALTCSGVTDDLEMSPLVVHSTTIPQNVWLWTIENRNFLRTGVTSTDNFVTPV